MSTIAALPSSSWTPSSSSTSGAIAMASVAANPLSNPGAKAAREFEAQLIGGVLDSLEKAFADFPGQDPIAGADEYNYLGTQAIASTLADAGGFGIARLITEHLAALHEGSPSPKLSPLGDGAKVSVTYADGTR